MGRRLAAVVLAAAAAAGCECGTEGGARGGDGTSAPRPGATTGTIVGIVRLAAGDALPELAVSPLVAEGRPPLPDTCTPPQLRDRTPITIADESGGLVGLSIVATGLDEARWPTATDRDPVTHEVAIHDCRLTPRLVVATRGDRLRLHNETPELPFFPDLGDGLLQYRTEDREVTLDRGGVRTIECAYWAPCGRLDLVTLYHPVHTSTGADGRFRLEGVPPGQEVRVTAWHPIFRESEASTTTTVGAGATVEVELTLRAPPPLPTPGPGPSPEGRPEGPVEDHPDPTAPF